MSNAGESRVSPEQAASKQVKASTGSPSALAAIASGNLIVYTENEQGLRAAVSALASRVPGLAYQQQLDAHGKVFLVSAPDAAAAVKAQSLLSQESFINLVRLDTKSPKRVRQEQQLQELRSKLAASEISRLRPLSAQAQWPGVEALPHDTSSTPRGGDPLHPNQWHFNNVSDIDNNIPDSLYTTDGLSGDGVTIGFTNQGFNTHVDVDHTDLDANFELNLSQPFDFNLLGDSYTMTAWAGITSAERGNGIGGHGIAPGSHFATFNWNESDLVEFQAYNWMNNQIDIKVFQIIGEYSGLGGAYNSNRANNFILDALQNSIIFGRGRKGVINIYPTGMSPLGAFLGITMPDPYNFPPSEPTFSSTDQLGMTPNEISISVTNGWTSGPFYVNGNTGNYPPANDRRTLIVNSVAEDGNYDVFGAQGPGVFASVYAGTTNQHLSGSQATSGDGVLTTVPGGGSYGELPADADPAPFGDETTTASSVTAGIIALMLDQNPNLKVRDIQHIFFNSIQESTKIASLKWPNFDVSRAYYFPYNGPPAFAPRRSFWQVNSALYNSDTITNQAIRHSDNYGFGMIDANLAIQMAATYPGSPPLFLLDTGVVGEIGDDNIDNEDIRLPVEIDDATFFTISDADGSTGLDGAATIIPGAAVQFNICVRQNIKIEAIVMELTITGTSINDLFIELVSPNGTRSILSMPMTANFIGTSDPMNLGDDELDDGPFNSGTFNGTDYALYQQGYLTWKHWGELSGGTWTLTVQDFGPNDINPEGEEPGTGAMPDPGADMVINLGEVGVPGSMHRDEQAITAFRFKVYGTDIGAPIFEGCDPFITSCPADLDGNGIVNVADLQIFLSWYTTGNAQADITGDGNVNVNDLFLYRGIWQPGFCATSTNPFSGGRPFPGSNGANGGDNNPIIRPI